MDELIVQLFSHIGVVGIFPRIPISSNKESVTFKWKDYRAEGQKRYKSNLVGTAAEKNPEELNVRFQRQTVHAQEMEKDRRDWAKGR